MSEDLESWTKALDDIKEWFDDHGCEGIVANLNGPTDPARLSELERKLGATLPVSLRWLYSVHGGQRNRETRPFFEDLVFCDPDYALALCDGMVVAYFNPPAYADKNTPLRDVELTQRWFPVANTSHAFLAVNLDSGRVVLAQKDVPAIRVVADHVGALLLAYAGALWDDKYRIAGDRSLDGVQDDGFKWLERYASPRGGSFQF